MNKLELKDRKICKGKLLNVENMQVQDRMAPHREATKYKTEWRHTEKPQVQDRMAPHREATSTRQNGATQRSP